MALQVWLPLNGNLNNQGLNNTAFTGSTTFEAGKLGQAGVFGTAAKRAISSATVTLNSQVTIAFWIKIKTWVNWGRIFNLYNSDKTNTISCVSNTSTDKRIGTQVSKNGTNLTDSYNGSFDLNTWYHFAMVVNGTTKQHYINGSLVGTATLSDSMVTTNYTVMCGGTADSGTPVDMNINDFRVYDNALAPKEIEILSRGLVCHYPLNNNGGGQPNLYDFESVASKWKVTTGAELTLVDAIDDVYGNVLKITTPSSVSSERIYRGVSNVWKADTNFTVSFLAKASKPAVMKIERSRTDYAPDVTVGTTWKRYSTVIPCSATTTGGALGIQTSTASADIYITQIKLELGDKATAYQPGVGDSHYVPLGYDSTTEYDVSGYGYNGTKNGTITYSSDTARYSVCTEFSKAGYIINNSFGLTTNAFTLNLWYKPKTATSQHFLLGTFDSWVGNGLGLYRDANKLDVQGVIKTSGTAYQSGAIATTLNTWQMLTYTYDGTNYKGYLNGILKFTKACTGTVSHPVFMIGNSKYSNTAASENEEGFVSDVRLYATALSAAQVAELYNTAVSVANNGTLMGYELVES